MQWGEVAQLFARMNCESFEVQLTSGEKKEKEEKHFAFCIVLG